MNTATLTKVAARTVKEVCKLFPLGAEAARLLRDGLTPRQYLELLLQGRQYVDAVRFLAHALPKREGVRWACQCVRAVNGPASPAAQAALEAAERWVADACEENRREAEVAATTAGLGTPAGCAAAAAFWSGGSLAPAHAPVVPMAETLTAQAVAGAVLLAAVATEPHKAEEKYRQFLARGVALADGGNGAEEAPRGAGGSHVHAGSARR